MRGQIAFVSLVLFSLLASISIGQTDCTDCQPVFDVDADTIHVACGEPFSIPGFPSWSNPCDLPTFESLSALTGGSFNESCGGVTAYGPGADFAVWINGLEQLDLAPSDYFLTGLTPLNVVTMPNGDIVVSGLVSTQQTPLSSWKSRCFLTTPWTGHLGPTAADWRRTRSRQATFQIGVICC